MALLWACLLISQVTWAQSVPDPQWARVGRTMTIRTDGTITTGDNEFLVTYSLNGDKLSQVGPIRGVGMLPPGKLPPGYPFDPYFYFRGFIQLSTSQDNQVLAVGYEIGDGMGVFNFRGSSSGGAQYRIPTPDGGYIWFDVGARTDYSTNPPIVSPTVTTVSKGGAQASWSRDISFPVQNTSLSDKTLTKATVLINTPDGGYLVAGYFNNSNTDAPELGWAAKLDAQGNVSWQKLLNTVSNSNSPGAITGMKSITDVILTPDGSGYTLVGSALQANSSATPTAILELDFNGNSKSGRAKAIDSGPFTTAYLTAYTGSNGKTYYAVGNTSLQDRPDPQILLVDVGTLTTVAKRIFPGPGQSSLTDIATAGDGSLVFVTDNNQLVKLQPEATLPPQPPVGAFALTAPTYNCSTGAFTFNTSGGNGSTIEYMAPGITGWTTNPNQFVDEGSRTALDVQPFTLMARQNGVTVTYIWNLRAYCNGTQPPTYTPIPNQTFVIDKPVFLQIGSYFSDPTHNSAPLWYFEAQGLPNGLEISNRSYGTPNAPILGTPTTAGTYTVTLVVSTNQARDNAVRATFQITIFSEGQPPVNPPPVGDFALTAPTYNCSTGAFTFNTSGGNGSTIEYMAPGITGWTTNPNQFVDEGSRTALDVQPFTLTARQNGITVTYIWDLRAYCNGTPPPPPVNPPTGGALILTAPTYNCTTGAFTFNTSGGNGTTIEYMAPGITGWTTNPNQFVDEGSRTANDVQPFILTARQNGVTVTYVWNLKAACGRARVAALPEPGTGLQVRVLGNPVLSQIAEVEITGVETQGLQLNLIDLQGKVLHQRSIQQAESTQRVSVPMGERSGVFLLNVSTSTQHQQVKLVKP
jgi:hypothetical protein